MIKEYSILNSVSATRANVADIQNGLTYISGLAPFRASDTKTAVRRAVVAGTQGVKTVDVTVVVGDKYGIITNFINSEGQSESIVWEYTVPVAGTDALFLDSYKTAIEAKMESAGYVVTGGVTSVVITAPLNVPFSIQAATADDITNAALTITDTTPAVNAEGRGTDLATQYGLPDASSATANDGIVTSNSYIVWAIPVTQQLTSTQSPNQWESYTKLLLLNNGDGDSAAVDSYLTGTVFASNYIDV